MFCSTTNVFKMAQKYGIELKLGATVEAVDTNQNNLSLAGGETISYDALLIATGSV